jgi:hypothetical protein
MMENARPVSKNTAMQDGSVSEDTKEATDRPKRYEQHKRKRIEKGEPRAVSKPRNARRTQLIPTEQGSKRACVPTEPTANANTVKTSNKKRPLQRQKKAGAATEQRMPCTLKKNRGQGERVVGQSSSKYRGVSWYKSSNKWKVQINYDGQQHRLGHFEDEEEAARAYDRAARAHQGEKAQLNFPTMKEQAAEEAKQQRWIKCGEAGSKYRGVNWDKIRNKWRPDISYDGKQHHLGYFEDEEEAVRAYDEAARAQHGQKAQLNFPAEGESGPRQSSKYRGVCWSKSSNK